jgi:phospholipid/cholesterol/gamma-HCH transport system substrate-binding protein
MNEPTMRFRLGIFILGALILLAVLITLFGGLPQIFRTFDHYTIVVNDASGISPGTPVRRSGVRIGEVEKVQLDNDTGKVRIAIKVDGRYTLRKSDEPVIQRNLLGGDAFIDFVRRADQAQADNTPLEPGAELQGRPATGATDLAQQASRVLPTAQSSLEELEKVLTRLDRMMPLFEETVRQFRDLARAGQESIPSLRATSDDFRELARSARAMMPELRRTNDEMQVTARNWGRAGERLDVLLRTNEEKLNLAVDRLNLFLKQAAITFNDENQRNLRVFLKGAADTFNEENQRNLAQTLRNGNDAVKNLQKASGPLADRTPTILRNLDQSSDQLNKTLAEMREFMRAATRADGTLGKLLNDPSLYNHLDEAACMVTRLLPRLDRVLRDAEIFADKIARHPEALGLGGVVRPSVGLKEAPSSGPVYHMPPN